MPASPQKHRMGDVMWELTLHMKDASSGKKVVTRTMKRCDICYYNIVSLVEEYGYIAMDYIYIKRYVQGQTGMVELLPETDVLRMLREHEAERKLSLYVAKYIPSLNNRADQGDSERSNGMETSHQNDHETKRAELNAELQAMKRRPADRGAILKTPRRPMRLQDMRHESEDEDYMPQDDGNMELTETEEQDEENIQDELELSENEEQDENMQDSIDLNDATLPDIARKPIKLICTFFFLVTYFHLLLGNKCLHHILEHAGPNGLVREVTGRFQVSNLMHVKDAKKTCMRNSESAKQQKHPHTTGRKSHPRLRKEMEDKPKQPVSKIDLWDEAHKKKNGSYANKNVQKLMDKAHLKLKQLKKRKRGNLSARDLDQVFDDVIANKLTIGGYYNKTYWGNARAYEGSTSGEKSAREVRLEEELTAMKSDLKFYTEFSQRMRALMEKKFPDENVSLMTNRVITENDDNIPTIVSTGDVSYKVGNIEKSMDNIASSENDPKIADSAYGTMRKEHHVNSYSPHPEQIVKACKEKELPKRQALQQLVILVVKDYRGHMEIFKLWKMLLVIVLLGHVLMLENLKKIEPTSSLPI